MTERGVTRLPEQACPLCHTTLDAHGTFDSTDDAPGPGDWTICSGCLQWLIFTRAMKLRPVTNAEWLALSKVERMELTRRVARVRTAWKQKRA